MGNTQAVWILYDALSGLNFLNANELKMTAVERHWIVERAAELNQHIFFRMEVQNGKCIGGEVVLLFPQEMKSCGFLQN